MKSGVYEYADVPQDVYDNFAATFQSAESSGKFLNTHLRRYGPKKVK
jgi:hypothetical protein